jgi:hypothetical protein
MVERENREGISMIAGRGPIMRRDSPGILLVVVCLILVARHPADSCSVAPGYTVPSTFELVKAAEVIVLAHSESFSNGKFKFRTVKVLKGSQAGKSFEIKGYDQFQGRSPPNDLDHVRPGALAGSCIAFDYRVDHDYVLFCQRIDAGLSVSGPPFSRINEEVDGEASPWTRAVQRYCEVASLGDAESEYQALEDLLRQASSRSDPKNVPPAMAHGIEQYLGHPSSFMPWTKLKMMYDSARAEKDRSAILQAMADCNIDGEKDRDGVRSLLGNLKNEDRSRKDLIAIAGMAARVRDSTWVEKFLEIYPEIDKDEDQNQVARAIRRCAGDLHVPLMVQKMKLLEPRPFALLAPWLVQHPIPGSERLLNEEGNILRARIETNHDKHWWETVALATLGDEAIVDWAIDDLARGGGGGCCGLHDYILTWSPTEKADRQVKKIIQDNDAHSVWVIVGGYRDSPWPPRWDRLEEIALHPGRHASVTKKLREFLLELASDGEEEARKLLKTLQGR